MNLSGRRGIGGFSQWVVEVVSLLVCDALSSGVYASSDTF